MNVARYKKGNKYHLVEHLYNDKPNGIIEVFDTEEEAKQRIKEMNETEKRIREAQNV